MDYAEPDQSTMSLPCPPHPVLGHSDIHIPSPGMGSLSANDPAALPRSRSVPASGLVAPTEIETPKPARRKRTDSVITTNGFGAESIFRHLPRETRPALRRMLCVEPSARCTLTDLLKGKGKTSALLCGCQRASNTGESGVETPPGGHCEDHDYAPEDEDDGDDWLKSLMPCSRLGITPGHIHVKLPIAENKNKRWFF
jgi:hypothetical protein